MAGSRIPGPIGTQINLLEIDVQTSAQTRSALPGSICVSKQSQRSRPNWGTWEVLRWKVLPERLGGDKNLLKSFKDSWVRNQRTHISELATLNQVPPSLLAGIAWIEVGGDPDWIDKVAYPIRAFDHAADPFLEPLTITKRPELTSFGNVSIQLRRAAETLDLDWQTMDSKQRDALVECLTQDDTNLNVVARHIVDLRKVDFPNATFWTDDQIRVVGARYNRGPTLPIEEIRLNTSYGDFILRNRAHVLDLLK